MKHILTSELRRAKQSLVSMLDAACDIKYVYADNAVSIVQMFNIYMRLLYKRHGIDAKVVERLYSFNQGELDELS